MSRWDRGARAAPLRMRPRVLGARRPGASPRHASRPAPRRWSSAAGSPGSAPRSCWPSAAWRSPCWRPHPLSAAGSGPGRTPCPTAPSRWSSTASTRSSGTTTPGATLLRRIDPELGFLRPVGGYPVISRAAGRPEDLTGLPARAAAEPDRAVRPLPQPRPARPARLRHGGWPPSCWPTTASAPPRASTTCRPPEFLAALGMSDRAQAMLFEAFARSFFAQPGALSAAELIAMFHYYFLGNPRGHRLRRARHRLPAPASGRPFAAYLEQARRARCAPPRRPRDRSRRPTAHRWRVELDRRRRCSRGTWCSPPSPAPCATCSPRSPHAAAAAPAAGREGRGSSRSRRRSPSPGCGSTATSRPSGATFNAVSREPTLDSITVYSRLEQPVGGVGRAHRRLGRRAALLRLHRPGRRHRHRPHAGRAGRAVAGDRRRARCCTSSSGWRPRRPRSPRAAPATRITVHAARAAACGWPATTSRPRSSPG